MIKFFRKIRQKLLFENPAGERAGKLSKYLLYAIGEIVLVVIGILMALQINNANEIRKEKILEKKVLSELVKEMKLNKTLLETSKMQHKMHDSISTLILEKNRELEPQDYLGQLAITTFYHTADFVNGNVESILSEHGPSIISNDTLREFITTWKDMAHDVSENELIEQELMFDHIYPTIAKHIDLSELEPLMNRKKDAFRNYLKDMELQNDIKQLILDQEFMGIVYTKLFNDKGIDNDLTPVLEKITMAISIAEQQLKK